MSPIGTVPPARRSAFAIAGRLLVIVAASAGVFVLIDRHRGLSGLVALTLGTGAGIAGVLLILADRRVGSWQQTALHDQSDCVPVFERNDLWIIFGLVLIGLVPRLIAMRHSLIFDELWTLTFVQKGPLYALNHQAEYNNHLLNSLLCSLLFEARAALAGAPAALDTSWYCFMRVPSLVWGTAASPLLYLALRTRLPRQIAVVAALLLAISPVAVDVSAQARGYSGMICLTITAALALDRAVRIGAPTIWLTWLVCAFLATLSHLYSAFAVLAGSLCLVVASARAVCPKQRRSLLEEAVLMTAIWALLSIASMAGILGVMLAGLRTEAGRPSQGRMDEILLPTLQRWCGSIHGPILPLFYLVCAILIGAGLIYLRRKAPGLGLYCLLLLFVPPIIVEIVQPHYVFIRFFVFSLPAFLVCITCGIQYVAVLVSARWPSVKSWVPYIAMVGCVVVLCLLRLVPVLMYPKQDFAETAAYLKVRQRSGDSVVVIGAGYQYFNRFGVSAFHPVSASELDRFVQTHDRVLVADTGIRVIPLAPDLQAYLRGHIGRPIAVFPARFGDWPDRSKDEESDFKVYAVSPIGDR